MMETGTTADTVLAPCSVCGHETAHEIVAVRKNSGRHATNDSGWQETYAILVCCGCAETVFRKCYREEHDYMEEPASGRWVEEWFTDYYPPPSARRRPDWLAGLRGGEIMALGLWEICQALQQVHQARDHDLLRLAAIGVRSVLDDVLRDTVGDSGSFRKRLERMCREGYVGDTERQHLQTVVEAGHAATHRGHTPESADVDAMIDAVEQLIHNRYVRPTLTERLKSMTPVRNGP